MDDSDVVAYRWVESTRHPTEDICDEYAKVDMYGLGPGIFPKDVEALMQSNGRVQEAARDSALIYARMIDSLSRNYKLPVENIVATISTHGEYPNGMYGSPVTEVYTGNETFDAVNLDSLPDKIGITGKDEESKQHLIKSSTH